MIKAPFNFVPLSEKVFFPPWANQVSHDIPFSDGESGVIDVTITAKSPIFVRNHFQEGDSFYHEPTTGKKISTKFCNHNGEFYIPGSTLKGEIRNVFEIMSFSKMSFIENQKYSVRDMTPEKYGPRGDKKKLFDDLLVGKATHCGFLVKSGNNYQIEECEAIRAIKHETFEVDLSDKTAQEKYDIFGTSDNALNIKIKKLNSNITDCMGKASRRKRLAEYDDASNTVGTLVFTGDINNKCHEFVFIKNNRRVNISKEVFESFENVYFKDENSDSGQYWKDEFNDGLGRAVPVFYRKSNNGNIISMGLTQLYKLEYKKSLYDGLYNDHKSKKSDLAQLIFGYSSSDNEKLSKYTDEEKKLVSALKGRVQFSHFKNINEAQELHEISKVLNSPKATYYPFYIKQNDIDGDNVNKYTTLMDNQAYINGWKRYPVHIEADLSNDNPNNEDILTIFKPLDTGAVFKGKIRFHNLRKSEIGALLSALTFHNTRNCFHNIGMAKPFGFGKIKIDINFENKDEYINEFERIMNSELNNEWKRSEQIQELFKMAQENGIENLTYMELGNPDERHSVNEFTEVKKRREYLKPYSQIFQQYERPLTPEEQAEVNRLEDLERERLEIELENRKITNFLEKVRNVTQTKEKIDLFNYWNTAEDSIKRNKNIITELLNKVTKSNRINKLKAILSEIDEQNQQTNKNEVKVVNIKKKKKGKKKKKSKK